MERHTIRAHGASATVSPHGAQVLSWVHGNTERLFLSPQATFEPGAAIRGGVPVIFPQFAERGPGPRHGFARTAAWRVVGEGDGAIELALRDSAGTRALWDYRFDASLTATLGAGSLSVALRVVNTGETPLSFTCALHSYLRVDAIAGARLEGLQGVAYQDSTRGGAWAVQTEPVLEFTSEVDRVYRDCPGRLVLADGNGDVVIRQSGFRDTVVWNPGAALAETMNDLGPGGHSHFACIEAACVHHPVALEPGAVWDGSQTLIV